MIRKKINLNRFKKATQNKKTDWIIRSQLAANFAQLGLLAFALFGYFYTVLPTNKYLLSEEKVAKQELELIRQKESIEAQNIKLEKIIKKEAELSALLSEKEKKLKVVESNLSATKNKSEKLYKTARKSAIRLIKTEFSYCFSNYLQRDLYSYTGRKLNVTPLLKNYSNCVEVIAERSKAFDLLNAADKTLIQNKIKQLTNELYPKFEKEIKILESNHNSINRFYEKRADELKINGEFRILEAMRKTQHGPNQSDTILSYSLKIGEFFRDKLESLITF